MSVVDVETARWRDAIAARLGDGARFAGAWAVGHEGAARWRAAFVGPDHETQVLGCAAVDGRVPTIVDLVPAADWDEREAHDLHGLGFEGHEPLRALVAHPQDPRAWMTPVTGDGVHEVAVGPIHAGVIESGHFRFHVVGERILALDARLFYKHRGLERAAEGRSPGEGVAYAQRACAACAVANTVAYAHAVEEALGLWPDGELRRARTLLLELERLYNHLHDIGALCAGVGFAPGTMAFAALKDRAQRINDQLAGHRFLFATIAVGAGAFAADQRAADVTAPKTLRLAGALEHASEHPIAQAIAAAAAAEGPLPAVEGFANREGLGVEGVVDGPRADRRPPRAAGGLGDAPPARARRRAPRRRGPRPDRDRGRLGRARHHHLRRRRHRQAHVRGRRRPASSARPAARAADRRQRDDRSRRSPPRSASTR